jgi:hypothetical protein
MRTSSVSRAIAFDGNNNPLLMPFSALSASLDLENKALVLSMSLSDGDPYVLITHDLGPDGPLLACAEFIGSREEVDVAATLGKLAVTAVATGLIAKGTHHVVGHGSHKSHNDTGGLNADSGSPSSGIAAIGAGSALLHLGHSGPEKTNILKIRFSIEDGTEVLLELSEEDLVPLDDFECVITGEDAEQFMKKRFAEIAGRLADGERSFSELDFEAEQLQKKIHELDISLTQLETYESRDSARKSLELLQRELFLKGILRGSLTYLLAYDKAHKSSNFELFDKLNGEAAKRLELVKQRRQKIFQWIVGLGVAWAIIGGSCSIYENNQEKKALLAKKEQQVKAEEARQAEAMQTKQRMEAAAKMNAEENARLKAAKEAEIAAAEAKVLNYAKLIELAKDDNWAEISDSAAYVRIAKPQDISKCVVTTQGGERELAAGNIEFARVNFSHSFRNCSGAFSTEILSKLAATEIKAGEYQKSIQHLSNALLLDPTTYSNWIMLSESYAKIGDIDMARIALKLGIFFFSSDEDILKHFSAKNPPFGPKIWFKPKVWPEDLISLHQEITSSKLIIPKYKN